MVNIKEKIIPEQKQVTTQNCDCVAISKTDKNSVAVFCGTNRMRDDHLVCTRLKNSMVKILSIFGFLNSFTLIFAQYKAH